MMTVDERERRAYIEGDTALAAVLGELVDAEEDAKGYDRGYQDGLEDGRENPDS